MPVGVFDGGIGSFDLVRRLRGAYPDQDIIYLADRASFPYGARSRPELLASVTRATRYLIDNGATSVVLASNAPSVTVLAELRQRFTVPILGVTPPVREALDALGDDAVVAVAGAGVMVDSRELHDYIRERAGSGSHRVVPVRADALIALVENGAFLDSRRVRGPILGFVSDLRARYPKLAGITLSSTHLPWLRPAFAEFFPDLRLFDPADGVVEDFGRLATPGSGTLRCVVTESPEHPVSEFRDLIAALGLGIDPTPVTISG
ncbi:glutamate racemase [Corynebacterium pacaense]|uniref:glutamate racemase n=1 Tax=Corynebacterium pacaense TaxID=1816684 RepID=UPI0009BC6451|nr:aspartate/glutamate racemase family protein [Corynebacterium pacaense]